MFYKQISTPFFEHKKSPYQHIADADQRLETLRSHTLKFRSYLVRYLEVTHIKRKHAISLQT